MLSKVVRKTKEWDENEEERGSRGWKDIFIVPRLVKRKTGITHERKRVKVGVKVMYFESCERKRKYEE